MKNDNIKLILFDLGEVVFSKGKTEFIHQLFTSHPENAPRWYTVKHEAEREMNTKTKGYSR